MRNVFLLMLMCIFSLFAQDNEDCQMCHADPDLTGTDAAGNEIPMYVDDSLFAKSVHGYFQCVDCHQDLQVIEDFPHEEQLEKVQCGNCHEDASEEYSQSMHGLKFINREDLAPMCYDCHGKHNIMASDDSSSLTYFQNLPNTCCGCHESKRQVKKSSWDIPCVRLEYWRGIHGQLLLAGIENVPDCNTCHPAHSIRKRIDPLSTTYKLNINNTCGQCHIDALTEYSISIHASALMHGALESATCTDCHGEHEILSADSSYIIVSHDACIKCHTDSEIMRKYGLPETVVSTYVDSYHGLSLKLGKKDAATCGSCHENHRIYPSRNLNSSVHEQNLVQTCGKCHINSSESFAHSYTHETMLIRSNPINYYITLIYIILIIGVIGAMFAHNLIIFIKYIRYKKNEEKQYFIIRFKGAEVFQHAILMTSFILLAISGFALKFPDAFWVKWIGSFGIDEEERRLIHRISAVVMVIICLYHIAYVIFTQRGRYIFSQIMLRRRDLKEVIQTVKYYLGFVSKRPEYEEFDYTEKVEYWALVWGNVVMAVTGFVLWFPTIVARFTPSWVIRASELIHFYEAILATLAILIFHLFFVIVHPEQYPMNLSWLTGKMSLRAAIKKHPLWIKRILKEKTNLDLLPEVIQINCKSVDDIEKFLKFDGSYIEP